MSNRMSAETLPRVAMIFSGGVGLGAYQAGAYAAIHEHPSLHPQWLAGSSVGAVNAAVIAGGAVEERIERLRDFWNADEPMLPTTLALHDAGAWGPWRHAGNWMSVLRTRVFGSPGHFRPRMPSPPYEPFKSLYDLGPLRARLKRLVDFGRLNSGEVRFSVIATDIESGDEVIFDTGKGDRIELDHLLASCGFLPEFAPVEISGRLLGDGGLVANAPISAVFGQEDTDEDLVCFVVDLYPRDGARPRSLETALARKGDLTYGNQTWQRLEGYRREYELRAKIAQLGGELARDLRRRPNTAEVLAEGRERAALVLYLSYRPAPEEAGAERPFDLSRSSVADRWEAGALDAELALTMLSGFAQDRSPRNPGLTILKVRRPPEAPAAERVQSA